MSGFLDADQGGAGLQPGVPIATGGSACPGCGFQLAACIASGTSRCPECGRDYAIRIDRPSGRRAVDVVALAAMPGISGAAFDLTYGVYNHLVFLMPYPDLICNGWLLGAGGVCLAVLAGAWAASRVRPLPRWVAPGAAAFMVLVTAIAWLMYADWC